MNTFWIGDGLDDYGHQNLTTDQRSSLKLKFYRLAQRSVYAFTQQQHQLQLSHHNHISTLIGYRRSLN